ncbi:MAG: hypothetical protein MJ075_00880 [Oscillospiraceae bacterium]|nr:hypothetical protein [Oscillospiraceae bacterium]
MKQRPIPKLNNRGAGLVTVLITILLLAAMGSLLMILGYTSYEMKASERKGKEVFYDAASVAGQIEAGLQLVVSDSITKAYSDALVDYSYKSDGISVAFSEAYLSALKGWKNSEDSPLFDGTAMTCDTAVLQSMVTDLDSEATLTLRGQAPGDSSLCSFSWDDTALTIHDLTIQYTAPNGRVSTIETDYKLSIPDMNYALSQYTVSGIPEFAVIAKGTLTQNTVSLQSTLIQGNAYAGSMDIQGTGQLKIENGTAICKDLVEIRGSNGSGGDTARLLISSSAGLWADTVKVYTNSRIALLGKSYLANDLNLAGTGASARLEGSYYGFGNSLTKSAESSSIIANGVGTTLDITSLDRLILAGYSFIGDAADAENVIMGESLSVKPNQTAYLVPVEYLKDAEGNQLPTNPDISTAANAASVTLDTDTELWAGKTLSDYGTSLRTSSRSFGGQTIVYYFMAFDTAEHRSQYFRDYYTANTDNIQQSINRYITVTQTAASLQTKGYTFTNENDRLRFNSYLDNASADILDSSAGRLKTMFSNLCQTLSTSSSAAGVTNPYDYVVNTGALSSLSGSKLYMDVEGNVVAMAVNGSYTYDTEEFARYPQLCLIVASGNVQITHNFSGLIISGSNMNLNASTILANRDEVVSAYTAKADDETTIRNYLNITIEDATGSADDAASAGWNVIGLVSTANWQKK